MLHVFIRNLFHNQFIAGIIFVAVGWFLLEIREILVLFFVAYIIMAALLPYEKFLRKKGMPQPLAVTIPFVSAILLLTLLIAPLVPFFAAQVQALLTSFPVFVDQAAKVVGVRIAPEQVQVVIAEGGTTISKNALFVTGKVFGGIFSLLTILVLSFYLLIDHERITRSIVWLFPKQNRDSVNQSITQVEEKLGAWLRGQVVLSLFIGSLTWIALTILGIQFALPLAVIAGLLEIVPTVGPIVSAIPAVIVALTISPPTALIVALLYFGIQMLENNVLVPKIMEKAVGLNPIVILLGVMIGASLMGIMGALLSIPFLSVLTILLRVAKED